MVFYISFKSCLFEKYFLKIIETFVIKRNNGFLTTHEYKTMYLISNQFKTKSIYYNHLKYFSILGTQYYLLLVENVINYFHLILK